MGAEVEVSLVESSVGSGFTHVPLAEAADILILLTLVVPAGLWAPPGHHLFAGLAAAGFTETIFWAAIWVASRTVSHIR